MDSNMNYSTQPTQPVRPMQPVNQSVSVGEWILTTFLLMIPCVGLILLFVWAFGDTKDTKPSKSNYAKAMLIWYAISIVLSVVFSSALIAVFTTLAGQLS